MSYGRFAQIYDQLMSDMPYDQWTRFLLEKKDQFNIQGKRLLDVGCGTGEWTLQIAQLGFEVTGIDLSDSMLAVASHKAQQSGVEIALYQQDMAEAGGFEPFDIITIFCDSLNYLETEEQLKKTIQNMTSLLNDGGLLIFDVHSPYKIQELFINQTFTYDDGEVAYIWNSFEGEHPLSVEHELSFFVLEDSSQDKYLRFDEFHKQRTYPVDYYKSLLENAGFKIESVNADFSTSLSPAAASERIFFTCRKQR
ncbi:class I SAM-dependent methyltransferase [Jeotgalibacillus sp. ET6]|uniref:class I SAM-dependent DNA methyltransferase n=1 Tax=Jeotgalibacillus sp. ET6 TaxID=3037260 RepID=UPI002418357B|nr:class I SAM-dependent methyltransferase [Jeotgalibacillus sp. ET6]MDG5470877.1 class I SAM-dependent methyltransferase [Jeotgalibacillus sp. ET6]